MSFRIQSDERRTIVLDTKSHESTIFGLIFVGMGLMALTGALQGAPSDRVEQWDRVSHFLLGVPVLLFGGLFVLSRRDTTTTLDHATGEGVHVVRTRFGKPTVTRFQLDEVHAIEIVAHHDDEGDSFYKLVLQLAGGRRLVLQGPTQGYEQAESNRGKLAAVLGIADPAALRSFRIE